MTAVHPGHAAKVNRATRALCAAPFLAAVGLCSLQGHAFPSHGSGAGVAASPTLAFTVAPGGTTGTSMGISGSYTVAAPSGLTGAVYGGGCSGSATISGFVASGGNWTATATTPASACTGTLSVTGTGSNTASATSPSATFGAGGTCPDDDGSSGASVGSAQYPLLLSGYAATINGTHGLGCLVAGVDYHVGLSTSVTLANPTSGGLPAGVSYSSGSHIVTISSNNVTFEGWDMSVSGGLELQIDSGVSGTIVQNNKFVVQSPNCLAPIRVSGITGTTTIQYNNVDGGSDACADLASSLSGDIYIGSLAADATLIYQWNYHKNIGEDGVDVAGPSSGSASIILRYNLFDQQGWRGHPDGFQACGGRLSAPTITHNTWYKDTPGDGAAGVQPFHIEAQCTSAISNGVVSYNTMVSPGTCNGGTDYPTGCVINFDIACKLDSGSNSNSGFKAYGNYVDWSGGIAPLLNDACPGTTWGSPHANYDMTSGTALSTSP